MLPHKQTRILDSSSGLADPTISILEFPDEEAFDNWLNSQNEIVEWNLTRLRNSTNSDQKLPEGTSEVVAKKGRPRTVEWTKNFTCSFGGTPRARSGESSQRTTSKPSRKVGCMAKIKAQKKFSCDTIYVTFLNQHSGHSLNTLKTWTWSRMSPSTRRWLEKALGSGMEWKELKRMTRVEVELANFFGAGEENLRSQIEVPEIMRISNQDFNNFRRKFLTQSAQLHSDCWLSLSIYAEMITQAGGVSTLQEVGGIVFQILRHLSLHSARIGKLKFSSNITLLYFWTLLTTPVSRLKIATERLSCTLYLSNMILRAVEFLLHS